MGFKINEVAKLTGVTVRTLHYYDEIGLLSPSDTTLSGYRLYDDEALDTLRQILFFRELDFSLKEIKRIIYNPNFNRDEALREQKSLLEKKRTRLSNLIALVDRAIKGEKNMSFEAFDMKYIEESKKRYAREVKERWGDTEQYAESTRRTKGYSKEQWRKFSEESHTIFATFATIRQKEPGSEQAMELVKNWQNLITTYFYECTNEILADLGQMYIADERFSENIDKLGGGTADFMSRAIAIFCAKSAPNTVRGVRDGQ